MRSRPWTSAKHSQRALPGDEEGDELQGEVADILTKANYEFVSMGASSKEVIAAKNCGPVVWTIGVHTQISNAGLEEELKRQFIVVGCNGVILICQNFWTLQSVAGCLHRNLRPEWQDRVGVTCIQALRLLFGDGFGH